MLVDTSWVLVLTWKPTAIKSDNLLLPIALIVTINWRQYLMEEASNSPVLNFQSLPWISLQLVTLLPMK